MRHSFALNTTEDDETDVLLAGNCNTIDIICEHITICVCIYIHVYVQWVLTISVVANIHDEDDNATFGSPSTRTKISSPQLQKILINEAQFPMGKLLLMLVVLLVASLISVLKGSGTSK
jgi:hypothetical protein